MAEGLATTIPVTLHAAAVPFDTVCDSSRRLLRSRRLLPHVALLVVPMILIACRSSSSRTFAEPSGLLFRRTGRQHRGMEATAMSAFFPGDASQAPSAPASTIDEGSEVTAALAQENRLLREQLELLVDEIRLLRTALSDGDIASTVAPAPAPPSAVAQKPAPAPAAPQPRVQSSFPTAPAPAPAKPERSTTAPAPAPSSFPTAPPPRQSAPSSFPVASPSPPVAAPPAPAEPQAAAIGQAAARVVSAGYENGNLANFYVDGNRIVLADAEADRRGLNVLVVDPEAGRVLFGRAYDIWGNPFEENKQLAADIAALPDGTIVMAALKDSGMENADGNLIGALQSLGATVSAPLAMREGYALIGVKGGVAIAERKGAEAEIEGVLPCPVQRLQSTVPLPPSGGAAPSAFQAQAPRGPVTDTQVASPKSEPMTVDPQGQVTVKDVEAEVEGQSWEEVLLMLDKLQDKIQAKRLGRDTPES